MAKKPDNNISATAGASAAWLNDLRYGRTVSLRFFKRNAWLLVSLLVAVWPSWASATRQRPR